MTIYITKMIFYIMSFSPIFCISDDNNFGIIDEYKKYDYKNFRVSIIGIHCGSKKTYLFTYKFGVDTKVSKGNEFKFIKTIKLNDYFLTKSIDKAEIKIGERVDNYEAYIRQNYVKKMRKYNTNKIDNEKINYDKEYIMYKIDVNNKKNDTANTKINIYNAMILAIIPIIITSLDIERFKQEIFYINILWAICLYMLLNIIALIFKFNKVKEFRKSIFSSVKQSKEKNLDCLLNYYYDLQFLQEASDINVSYIKNIDKYIKNIIIILITIVVLKSISIDICKPQYKYEKIEQIISINLNMIRDGNKEDLNKLQKVYSKVIDGKYDIITIIVHNEDILSYDVFNTIENQLFMYDKNLRIKIMKDNLIENENMIKIILGED